MKSQKSSSRNNTIYPKKVILRLPAPHAGGQQIFVNWSKRYRSAQALIAPCGTKVGKCLNILEKIPTPDGFKLLRDIEVGDYVFGDDGRPTEVLWVSDSMYDHECYELTFIDGNKIIADAEHLWVTETHYERKNQARNPNSPLSRPKVRSTVDIRDSLQVEVNRVKRANHSIRLVSGPLQYPEKALLIEPYVLGVWLGDGTCANSTFTKHYRDLQISAEIETSGESVSHHQNRKTHRIKGMAKRLRILGLINNKHIPNEYLRGSPEQRLALIQGLMDTDGTISISGKCCFDNTNKSIADGMAELLVSMGIKIFRSERWGRLKGMRKRLCYRINFTTDIPVFRLRRKLDRMKPVSLKNKHRTIIDIKPVPSVPVKCIKVDNPRSMYLVGEGCIPTHNTFGSSLWILTEALTVPGSYCVWVAPNYLKCGIAFRYITRMLPKFDYAQIHKTKLEIRLINGSTIKFLHGSDAETVIEGENVDRFVIDEAGKIKRQVWYSLFTTITQTRGKGIITGTPRGFTWYYELFKQAQQGDPFFVHAQIQTISSPYISRSAVETAERLLPAHLFAQYYKAEFISAGSVFGDLSIMWDMSLQVRRKRYWLHPDADERKGYVVHGVDIAKKKDYTVFYSVAAASGKLVGYVRVQHMAYTDQIGLLKTYIGTYFGEAENLIRYDQTGVGEAFGDMLNDSGIPAEIDAVIFTNKVKAEMLTRMMLAIQNGWHKAPLIPAISHELSTYEITVSKFGSHKFSAPDGENDDIVSAAMLSLSAAYYADRDDQAMALLVDHFSDGPSEEEIVEAYTKTDDKDDFFSDDDYLTDETFDEDLESM